MPNGFRCKNRIRTDIAYLGRDVLAFVAVGELAKRFDEDADNGGWGKTEGGTDALDALFLICLQCCWRTLGRLYQGGYVNTLILNPDTFQMPDDGWYQIAPVGEFPHSGAGVVQVVDRAACDAMVNAFRADAMKPNFAGLLIDFDHFSLDEELKSEAAGWITALEARFQTTDGRPQTADCRRLQRRGFNHRRHRRHKRDHQQCIPCPGAVEVGAGEE